MKTLAARFGLAAAAVGLAVILGCGKGDSESATKPAETEAKPVEATESQSAEQGSTPAAEVSPEQLLEQMVKAYRYTPSYGDAGRVQLKGELPGQAVHERSNLVVAFVRPNKILIRAGEGNEVGDGESIYGTSGVSPGWVLKRRSPEQLTIESLFGDFVLASSMAQVFTETYSWVPIQVVLLLADDPMKTLMHGVTGTRLLRPAKIDEYDCHRVEITRADGTGVFWIDQRTFTLRRFEYPVDTIKNMLGARPDSDWSLVADFTDAQLGHKVDPNAFRFAVPPGAKTTLQLLPTGVELLGKRSGDFIFVGLDNKPVTRNSLAGKIVVIDFWSMGDPIGRETLRRLQQAYEQYKDDPKVRFLPVNIDPTRNLSNADLEKALKELGVDVAVYRDSEQHAAKAFGLTAPPTTVVLGPDGIVQAYRDRLHLLDASVLDGIIKKLLAGEEVYPEGQEIFKAMATDYGRLFEAMVRRDLYTSPIAIHQELLRSETAERSEPSVMKVSRLWTSEPIEMPGGLLVLSDGSGPVRILICAGREVVELDGQGKTAARHQLGLPQGEFVAFLRSAVDGRGRRWFVGSAAGMQRVHVFDQDWKLVRSFPAEMPKQPHAGVGDARIADLEGDGTLEVCIGYRGLVGVKGVSLDGKVLWSQRSLADVFKMAVGAPSPEGRRWLFCTNNQCTLAALDGGGNEANRIEIAGRLLYWIAAADLDRNGNAELCGLSAGIEGENEALFFSSNGTLHRRYGLPKGLMGPYVELVAPAWLKPGQPGQWVIVGADGSLHVVSATGEPIDRFNYGSEVMGVAFAQVDGKPALLISSGGKVEAWAVEWP